MNIQIKGYALAILLFMVARGLIFFQLPSLVTKTFGTNSWIVIYVYTALVIGHMWLIYKGSKKHKGQSIFTIIKMHFPKVIAVILIVTASTIFLLFSYNLLNSYAKVLQFTSDPSVNIAVVTRILITVVLFTAGHGLYTITKTSVLYYIFSFWIVFFEVFQFSDFSSTRLTPFILEGGDWSAMGMIEVLGAFLGYELLMLITPYLDKNMKWLKFTSITFIVLGSYYTMYCLLTQGLLPYEQIKKAPYVVLRLYGATRINALEYITDLLFVVIIFSAILTSALYTWAAIEGFKTFQSTDRHKENLAIAGALLFSLSCLPINVDESKIFLNMVMVALVVMILLFTLFYFIFSHKPDNGTKPLPENNSTKEDNGNKCNNNTSAPSTSTASSAEEGVSSA